MLLLLLIELTKAEGRAAMRAAREERRVNQTTNYSSS